MLELRVLLVETETNDRGFSRMPIGDEAAQLTRQSFYERYGGPAIAQAWVSLANAVETRRKNLDTDSTFRAESSESLNGH